MMETLTKIAVFFQTTHGLPLEVFNHLLNESTKNDPDFPDKFVRGFIKIHKDYCEKNGIVV